jgi:hypothetical protein
METPDQLQERLERMGEPRVRGLVSAGHFEPKTVPFVKDWLTRKRDAARDAGELARTQGQRDLDAVRAVADDAGLSARSAAESAKTAAESAGAVHEAARTSQRMAYLAVVLAGAGLLIALLTLFALAMR